MASEVSFQRSVGGIGDVPQGDAVRAHWMTVLTSQKRIKKTHLCSEQLIVTRWF